MRMHLLVGLALAGTAVAHAQGREPLRQPESVPFELAAALAAAGGLANEGPGQPHILVGELPEWVRNRIVLPSGATVLGSAFIGSGVIGILRVPREAGLRLDELESGLRRLGWTLRGYPPSGGFRRASEISPGRAALPLTFCTDGQSLHISEWAAAGESRMLVLRFSPVRPGFGVCTMPPDRTRSQPLPTLYNPEAAEMDRMIPFGCATDPFRRGSGTSTQLRTALDADSLFGHYGRQLVDSGWTSLPATTTEVKRSWIRPDSTGRPLTIELRVSTSSGNPTCRDVGMTLNGIER